ncbi:hypothetical protein [Pseudofrankia sp. DC12]|uniref:hypothetical protein n=1 Tax=Pseudofrankia sp. DC12 TaxID=683315 RepID=UPI0005F88E8A|nr:hypothetical protein [Pseudofrankia sp. DC12]
MSPTEAAKPLDLAGSPAVAPGPPATAAAARRYREPRFVVLCLLGVAMLASIGGWIAMVLMNKEVPDGFPVVIGTVLGGLVGIAASDRPT